MKFCGGKIVGLQKCSLIIVVLGWLLGASYTNAEDYSATHFVSLPTQPLGQTLINISEIFNIAVIVDSQQTSNLQSLAINGAFTLHEILTFVLTQHGLTFHFQSAGVLIFQLTPDKVESGSRAAIEEVAVTGFRKSLQRATELRKNSIQIIDSIVAADIARYPDLNIAESLQRIPGVTITREAGEGRQVSLRGGLADFTQLQINGMATLANNDSPFDSRIQKQRDRSFDLNIFGADLFKQAVVNKTYSAEQTPGGLAGAIELKTARPFEKEGWQQRFEMELGSNEYTRDLARRGNILLSDTYQHFGWLTYVSHGVRSTEEQGINTFRWRPIALDFADLTLLSTEEQQRLTSGQVIVPRGNRQSVWQSQQSRTGIATTLQYRSEKWQWTADVIAAQFLSERDEFHLNPRGEQSTPVIPGLTVVDDVFIDAQNELLFAQYRNARTSTESRYQRAETSYWQFVWEQQISLSDTWDLDVLLGRTESDYDMPDNAKVYAQGVSDLRVDYRRDPFYPDIHYDADLTQPQNWRMREIDTEEYFASNDSTMLKAQLSWLVKHNVQLSLGAETNYFTNDDLILRIEDQFLEQWQAFDTVQVQTELSEGFPNVIPLDNRVNSNLTQVMTRHRNSNWLTFNVPAVLGFYEAQQNLRGAGLSPGRQRRQLKERLRSVFTLLETDTSLFDRKFFWQLGARFTELRSQPYLSGLQLQQTSQFLLPTVHLKYQLTNTNWLKLAYSHNFANPQLNDNSGELQIDHTRRIVSGANPFLTPYRVKSTDLAFEYYTGDEEYITLGLFHKRLDDYVLTQARQKTLAESGFSEFLASTQNSDINELYTFILKQNVGSTDLTGIELGLRQNFSFLNRNLRNLGWLLNYTYADGKLDYFSDTTGEFLFRKRLPNLSRNVATLTLFWEKENFGMRLSGAYQDDYIARVDSNTLQDEDETGFHDTLYLDFAADWQVTQKLILSFNLSNLTDQREEQYSDSSNRAYNTTQSGRTFYFGLNYRDF